MNVESVNTGSSGGTFSSTLDAAMRYADRGWPVFPCNKDKHPCVPKSEGGNGFHDATTDHEKIVAWWRRWPDAQIGVACGAAGICVIDLDLGKGKDGITAFARVADDRPTWCELIATTPRGGRHYIYLMPSEPVGCKVDVIPDSGIDVRAEGGYIVVPSPSSPGREWSIGDPFDHSAITTMPEWLETLVRGGRRSVAASGDGSRAGGKSAVVMPLDDGQVLDIRSALAHIDADPRETWITVGMALKSTSAGEQAYQLWEEWAATSPRYGSFDQRKHWAQWESLSEYRKDGSEVTIASLFHLAKQGGWERSIDDEVRDAVGASAPSPSPSPTTPRDISSSPAGPPASPPPKLPFDRRLMDCPGLVGDVAAWMVESSRRRQPAMCLASSIVTLGALLGRRVATPTDLRTNVYALGIGETACGKDPSVKLPHLLLTRAGLGSKVGPGEWKSDSGLRAALIDAPSHAAYIDEFTKLLDMMSGRQVPGHVKGIKKYLLDLWAASNSVHLSAAYANRQMNKPVIIEQPNLCVYGVGVPSELFSSLDRGAMSDGFLNRMLIFFADEQQPEIQRIGRAEPPEELVQRLRLLQARTFLGDLAELSTTAPSARIVRFTTGAEQVLERLEKENDERIRTLRQRGEPLADLWVRFGAHVAKLALIRAVCDDTRDEWSAVDVPDVDWGVALSVWCLERTMAEADSRVADSMQEAATKKLLRTITATGADGITSSILTRKSQDLRRGDRKDILATLIESGQVVSTEMDTGAQRPVTVYFATTFVPVATGLSSPEPSPTP